MKKQTIIALAAVAATASMVTAPASAYEKGDWTFKAGITNVAPKDDNGTLSGGPGAGAEVHVDDATTLSLLGDYFFTPALSLELLASLPFTHDFTVAGGVGGSVKQLPPTLSLVYHFNSAGTFIPYLGLGVNYTAFFSEETYGDLAGVDVDIENSWGGAVQIGSDFVISDKLFFNVDVRYIGIEPDVKVNGVSSGDIEIDPITVGVNIGYRF